MVEQCGRWAGRGVGRMERERRALPFALSPTSTSTPTLFSHISIYSLDAPPRSLSPPHPQAKQRTKAPFSVYAALEADGVKVAWGSPADPAAIPAGPFDVVYDNNGKDVEACQPLIDAFKVCACASGGRERGVCCACEENA